MRSNVIVKNLHGKLKTWADLKRTPKEIKEEIHRSIAVWTDGIEGSVKSFEEIKEEFEQEKWKKYKPFIQDLFDYKKES